MFHPSFPPLPLKSGKPKKRRARKTGTRSTHIQAQPKREGKSTIHVPRTTHLFLARRARGGRRVPGMEVVVVIGMGKVALEGWKQLCRGGSTLSEVPIFCNDKCTPQRLGRERNWRYASKYLFFFFSRGTESVLRFTHAKRPRPRLFFKSYEFSGVRRVRPEHHRLMTDRGWGKGQFEISKRSAPTRSEPKE